MIPRLVVLVDGMAGRRTARAFCVVAAGRVELGDESRRDEQASHELETATLKSAGGNGRVGGHPRIN